MPSAADVDVIRKFHGEERSISARPVRVALLGLGKVGRGLADLLARRARDVAERHGVAFRIERALVRDASRPRAAPPGVALTDDAEAFLAGPADVAVEATSGVEPAHTLVRALLLRGVPVVTANKALVAERGDALREIARRAGAAFRCEASVAAGIPLLSVVERSLLTTAIHRVTAILNATSNCVLSALHRGERSIGAALAAARERGFAEADPALDISGRDAAAKLAILARAAAGRPLSLDFEVEGIERVVPKDADLAARLGHRLKPIARAEILEGGVARGFVAPALVPLSDPLARVDDETNGVRLEGDAIESLFLSGPGAGALPTAASILDDLVAVVSPGGGLAAERLAVAAAAPRRALPERRVRLAGPALFRVLDAAGGGR